LTLTKPLLIIRGPEEAVGPRLGEPPMPEYGCEKEDPADGEGGVMEEESSYWRQARMRRLLTS
jgi:hypothetical protein